MKKICIFIFVYFLLNLNNVDASWLNYNIEELDSNNIRINFYWRDSDYDKGVKLLYHHITNQKTITVGYEESNTLPQKTYMDINKTTLNLPIRVILSKHGSVNQSPFYDIKQIEAEEYIRHLHDVGIVVGRERNKFSPFENITRAEFMVLMVKALGIKEEDESDKKFLDIENHWGEKIIQSAYKNGIVSGYPDGTFKPNHNITLAEVSSIISRAFRHKTIRDGIYSKLSKRRWYTDSVKSMLDLRIINIEDNMYKEFDEEVFLNRANAAMMISRALSTY